MAAHASRATRSRSGALPIGSAAPPILQCRRNYQPATSFAPDRNCRRDDSDWGTVAVLGLSYKPSTPVIEESQGIILAKLLKDAGFKVVAHDPMANGPSKTVLADTAQLVTTVQEALARSELAVIVTPWPQYAEISPDGLLTARPDSSLTAGDNSRLARSAIIVRSSTRDIRRPLLPQVSGLPPNERPGGRSPRPRMTFFTPYRHEFLRVAACVPRIGVGILPLTWRRHSSWCSAVMSRRSP